MTLTANPCATPDTNHVHPTLTRRMCDLFGPDFPEQPITCFKAGPETPAVEPNYLFRAEMVRIAMLWLSGTIKKNLYLSGPTSTGKSSFVEQFCARMGWEVFRFPAHKDVEIVDLTGGMDLTPNGTEFIPGIMLKALEAPAGILLLDEQDLMNPAVNAGLHTLLDGKPLWIPQAKRFVSAGPNFRIAATGNSAGLGDSTRVYKGVQRMSVATVRRYLHLSVDYLSEEEEVSLLTKLLPELDSTAMTVMVKVAALTRAAFVGGLSNTSSADGAGVEQLDVVIGTDTLITWAKLMLAYEKSPSFQTSGKDALVESLYPAILNCLQDPGNAHKAHSILGFVTRVRDDLTSAN